MDSQLVAEGVCEMLRKRQAFRRAMKMKAEAVMQAGAKGVWIVLAGRLGGAEMSRTLDVRLGALPLSTLQANIDYGFAEAFMSYGAIGCKVWIFKGLYEKGQSDEQESTAAGGRVKSRGRR
jgi:small subunit ribosomal protein S3